MNKSTKFTKAIYSFTYSEVGELIEKLWLEKPHHLYENNWLKAQDDRHIHFINEWKAWVKDVLQIPSDFAHSYYCNGSSEAIKEALTMHSLSKNPTIHIFEGEYEGYEALAKNLNIKIVKHKRENWKNSITKIKEGDQFYISQPSSIDGNIWGDFNEFAKSVTCKLMLDVAYLGATKHNNYKINIYDSIHTIFFSLSKPFGVYYHRIGGVISKESLPNLYGNKWFKNIFSVELGMRLLKKYKLGELPKSYVSYKQKILENYNSLSDCDVFLMATNMTKTKSNFSRLKTSKGYLNRYCLTPKLHEVIKK